VPTFYNAAYAAGIPSDLAYENLGRALAQDTMLRAFIAAASQPRVVCDIDGTLAQRDQAALVAINAKFDTQYRYTDMKTTKEDWIDDPEAAEWYKSHRHDDIFLVDLPAYENAIWGLWSLRSGGYHITIASDREDKLLSLSKTWLREHGVEYDDIHIGKDEKLKIAEASSPDDSVIFIDDNPERADDLPGPGRTVLLLDRPWNQDVKESDRVKRVFDWAEIMTALPAQSPETITIRKTMEADIAKVGWDDDLHPRGQDGRFETSGAQLGQTIVDRNLQGKSQGSAERSPGVHAKIVSELRAAGLKDHADHYAKIVQEAKDKGTLVHPRNVFGRANARVHEMQTGKSLEHIGWHVDQQLGRKPRSDSKQTGGGKTTGQSPLEKEWADNRAKAFAQYPQLAVYGDTLHISTWDNRYTQRSLLELSRVPSAGHAYAAAYFKGGQATEGRFTAASGIYIDGSKTITGLNKLDYLQGTKTSDGRLWQNVGGVHSSGERVIALGDLSRSGSINTAAHELGHALDHANYIKMGTTDFNDIGSQKETHNYGVASYRDDFRAARDELVKSAGGLDMIDSYFKQSYKDSSDQRGRLETFAEGFACYVEGLQGHVTGQSYTTLQRFGLGIKGSTGTKAMDAYFEKFLKNAAMPGQ
jgi:uncharacterized HAD superfamily protein